MNTIKFSVITITYNSSQTVERTLISLLSQTYKNFEYIIVDGASSDNTIEIIEKYEPLFEGRMKWRSEKDNGIYNAMNKGVSRATGDIIGIVNSDDWLEPNTLQIVFEMSQNVDNACDALYCGSVYFHYENGEKQLLRSNRQRFFDGIPKHSYNYGAYHPAIFVGRSVYSSVGLFDENFKIEADTDFIYRCYLNNKHFEFTDEVLSNMADGGISNVVNLKKYYKEKKYFIKKNSIKGIKAFVVMSAFIMRILIKKYVPTSISIYFREIRKIVC